MGRSQSLVAMKGWVVVIDALSSKVKGPKDVVWSRLMSALHSVNYGSSK